VWPKVYLPLDCHGTELSVDYAGASSQLQGLALPLHLGMNMQELFGRDELGVYEDGPTLHLLDAHELLLADERVDPEDLNVSLAVHLEYLEETFVRFRKYPFFVWLVPHTDDTQAWPSAILLTLKQYWTSYTKCYAPDLNPSKQPIDIS